MERRGARRRIEKRDLVAAVVGVGLAVASVGVLALCGAAGENGSQDVAPRSGPPPSRPTPLPRMPR